MDVMRYVMWNFENMIIRLQATHRIENFINIKNIPASSPQCVWIGWWSASDAADGRGRCLGALKISIEGRLGSLRKFKNFAVLAAVNQLMTEIDELFALDAYSYDDDGAFSSVFERNISSSFNEISSLMFSVRIKVL